MIDLSQHGIIVKDSFAFFWGGVFSNWYKSPFILHGVKFSTVEQWFMAQKAIVFDDDITLNKILNTDDPAKIKQLGKEVKNYNDKKWAEVRYPLVYEGVFAKFDQNPLFQQVLLNTENLIICENSPYDKIWGTGNGMDNLNTNPGTWTGTNLLGMILMDARYELSQMEES